MKYVLALVAVSLGCSTPDFASCVTRCGTDGDCPPGLVCLGDGLCHVSADEPLCSSNPDTPDAAQACSGDTCATPPSPCHEQRGSCVDGRCVYDFVDGAPCTGAPPPNSCDGSVLHQYSTTGACAAGTCRFTSTDRTCPYGCSGSDCVVPQGCQLACEVLAECNAAPAACPTNCRDQCTTTQLSDLQLCLLLVATCADIALCEPFAQCLM